MTTIRIRCGGCGAPFDAPRGRCGTCGWRTWQLVRPTPGDWAAAQAALVDAAGVVSATLDRGQSVRPQSEPAIRLQAAWRTLALLREGVVAP
jgi:hypothetical protein